MVIIYPQKKTSSKMKSEVLLSNEGKKIILIAETRKGN